MPRRWRLLRWGRWTCAAALVITLAVWALSHVRLVTWAVANGRCTYCLDHGVFVAVQRGTPVRQGFVEIWKGLLGPYNGIRPDWNLQVMPIWVSVPLWMPSAMVASVTALLWWWGARVRRRERAGQCLRCGYIRTGLPAGAPCPECGAANTIS